MVLVNYAECRINCKIVYYGAGESGKTTNISYIYNQLDPSIRSEMTTLDGFNERTLFFDFLSINLGEVRGFTTCFSLYSVPGQIEYNAARKLMLNGVDGIIFIADSRVEKRDENVESFNNMIDNLSAYGLSPRTIPVVLQYNKRDADNILSIETLESDLNKNRFVNFEAVANEGSGVFACLKAVSNLIISGLQ